MLHLGKQRVAKTHATFPITRKRKRKQDNHPRLTRRTETCLHPNVKRAFKKKQCSQIAFSEIAISQPLDG